MLFRLYCCDFHSTRKLEIIILKKICFKLLLLEFLLGFKFYFAFRTVHKTVGESLNSDLIHIARIEELENNKIVVLMMNLHLVSYLWIFSSLWKHVWYIYGLETKKRKKIVCDWKADGIVIVPAPAVVRWYNFLDTIIQIRKAKMQNICLTN